VWPSRTITDLGLFAYVVGTFAVGAQSMGHEFAGRTLSVLLAQPTDRRRLYAIKFAVAAIMIVALAAFAGSLLWRVWEPDAPLIPIGLPVLGALFFATFFTLVTGSALAGMVMGATLPMTVWLAMVMAGWFAMGLPQEATTGFVFEWVFVAATVVCPLIAVAGWHRFVTLEVTDTGAQGWHFPHLLWRSRQRRPAPLAALVIKELHLQQLSMAIALLYLVTWPAGLLLRRMAPSLVVLPLEAMMLFYSVGLAIAIGAMASAAERQMGTRDQQLLQPIAAWRQWLVKVAVTMTLALLLGFAMPALLIGDGPGVGLLSVAGNLSTVIVLLVAGSLYLSSLSNSGVVAMAWTLPAGMVALILGQAAGRITLRAFGVPLEDPDTIVFLVRTVTALLVPLLLWLAFRNHRSLERRVQTALGQLALVGVAGTAALALAAWILSA
jgi:hypothetical protein